MPVNVVPIINLSLRTATLGARFVFIFFLARFMDPASVGYYGLFTAAVGYAMYFVGLDFYTYNTREIIQAPQEVRGRLIKGQVALSGVLYLIFLPVFYVLTQYAGWPGNLVIWFFPILIFEHLNQEISRLLIALSEQLTASAILFIRQGSWALAIVALMALDPESRQLQTVMGSWAIAGFLALIVGAAKIWQLRMGGWRSKTDWAWIRKGLLVSAGFLVATLALRGIQTADRYWLELLGGIEVVGAYVLLIGVASTLMTFLDAGLFAFAYPRLIELNRKGDYQEFQRSLWRLLVQTLAVCIGFGLASWIALPYLLNWINEPVYLENIALYPWLLLATTLNGVGMVPHYALYARGLDRPIIASHLVAAAAFVASVWVLGPYLSAMAVPIGLNIAFAVILAWKALAYRAAARSSAMAERVASSL